MQSYNIDLDEKQRLHIIEALEKANLPIDPENDSLVYLLEMLKDLPNVEKENPGVIHGFAL